MDSFITIQIPDSVVNEYIAYRLITCNNDDAKKERFLKKSSSEKLLECFWHGFYETKYHASRLTSGEKSR